MKQSKFLVTVLFFLLSLTAVSREGMWLPYFASQMDYERLKANGFKLTADDIYNLSQACLTDAVLIFGDGCTGEVVSANGLIFTNHHCGMGQIQAHSTLENNYLRDGFWAKNYLEELPNPGLTVKFLVGVKDFSKEVLSGVDRSLPIEKQLTQIDSLIEVLQISIEDTSSYKASIESFYAGNFYYLFLYKEYADVRLVGTPPESIANFGRDTDNWIWPRHACDFSVFRIYTSPDGKPAEYAANNIPMKPEKYLTISTKGVKENDFTMVLGYPGQTNEYLYSRYLDFFCNTLYPIRIKLRDGRLSIINSARRNDERVYRDYASKQQQISNSYKKWKGVVFGVNRFDIVEKREAYEQWLIVNAGEHKQELIDLYQAYNDAFAGFSPYSKAKTYFDESVWTIEPFDLFSSIYDDLEKLTKNPSEIATVQKDLVAKSKSFFRFYHADIDKELTMSVLRILLKDMGSDYMPSGKITINDEQTLQDVINTVYETSIFTDSIKFEKAVQKLNSDKLSVFFNDPMVELLYAFGRIYYSELVQTDDYYSQQLTALNKEYILLIQQIDTTRKIYPDANFTMRLTYGKVKGYSPSDGVYYNFQTTLDGLIEKSQTHLSDYSVPSRLVQMYQDKDFGVYADSSGKLPLCFAASNHTSGGNSGSPVLDSEGKLIGINFDRVWEGTMSDFYYDESICRNIAVDIRYVLFIIDKYSGAGYLLDEMDIRRE